MACTTQDIEEHLGLVHIVAHSLRFLQSSRVEHYDLVNDGIFGLVHALENFDPTRGYHFSSYASTCIRGSIFNGQRRLYKEHWKARKVGIESGTSSLSFDQDLRTALGDHGEAAESLEDSTNAWMLWKHLPKLLTPEQMEVLNLLCQGIKPGEIGGRLGITKQAVSQRWLGAGRRIRNHYRQEGIGT